MGLWHKKGELAKGNHHVDRGRSLGGAVGAHGLGDVPTDMDLQSLADGSGKVWVGQKVPRRVVHRLRPHVATLAAQPHQQSVTLSH